MFDKLNKIIFVAGIVAIITLVLIVVNFTNEVIEGVWGTISLLCLLVIFLFGMFAVLSVVLAIIEGMKKDKRALLKKFLSNVTWISIAYIVPCILDYFYETEFSMKFEFGKIAFRVLATALAIMGGEYMITDHSKENYERTF